jgi:anaerobic ribonucleoside-triphosphate reductase activating protein
MNNQLILSDHPMHYPVTYTNGPGLRYVMWTQGCSIRCTNRCLNPELQGLEKGMTATVDQVLEHLKKLRETLPIEGITILGGEPTDQAAPLIRLARDAQKQNLTTMIYTGLQFEELGKRHNSTEIEELLQSLDILVEGNYDPQQDFPGTLWRGSINQRIILLTPKYDIDRIKKILRSTNGKIKGTVDIIEYYNKNQLIRKHWLHILPQPQAHQNKTKMPQQEEKAEILYHGRKITAWIPELTLEGQEEQVKSPKGIAGLLDRQNQLHLFGFQKEEVVRQFKNTLQQQGIKLNFNT